MVPIMFVFPRVLKEVYYEGCDYHLGAGYIRAYLALHGIASTQYVDDGHLTVGETAAAIVAFQPQIVGFSVYDANYYYMRLLAEEIKNLAPDVTIVCGGPSATFSAELILGDSKAVDVVVEGYGEEATLDLICWKSGTMELDEVSGIVFRHGEELRRQSKIRERQTPSATLTSNASSKERSIENGYVEPKTKLDEYPDPYVKGFIPVSRVSDIGIVTSRGCAFPCTFCNFAAMSGRKVTFQSLEKVMEILEFLDASDEARSGGKLLVTINDDNFTMHGKRFHELLHRMQGRHFERLDFWAEMRVEPLEERSFGLLRAAGFREVNFGLESAVPSVLASIKKVRSGDAFADGYEKERQYIDKIKWAVEGLHKSGIETCVSVIFGSPTETIVDAMETIDFIGSLPLDRYAHNYITVRLGTELAETYSQHGITTSTVPGRPLPLLTHTAYDIHQIPILPHDDSQLPIRGLLLQDAAFLLSGTGNFIGRARRPKDHGRGGAGSESGRERPMVFALREGALTAPEEVAEWLSHIKPMSSMVWILQQGCTANTDELEAAFAAAGVATLELQIMTLPSQGLGEVEVGGKLTGGTKGIITIHPRPLGSLKNLVDTVSGTSPLQLLIETDEDTKKLSELTTARSIVVSYSYLQRRVTFKDGCRWSHKHCPAASAERVVVKGNEILPCPAGSAVGRVGDSIQKLRDNATQISDRERARRGCDGCAARDRCSQCLFTAPFSVETFCEIQRRGQNVDLLVDGLSLATALMDTSDPIPPCNVRLTALTASNVIEVGGTTLCLSDCILLSTETETYNYIASAKHGFVAKLSTTQRQLIEMLN